MFCKEGVLKNFVKSTGNQLCQSLFFNKVAGIRPATLLTKRLWYRCFPVNFAKFLRILFYRTPPVATFVLAMDDILACLLSNLEWHLLMSAGTIHENRPKFIRSKNVYCSENEVVQTSLLIKNS